MLQRMLSRDTVGPEQPQPLGHNLHTEPAPGALLVQNQPFQQEPAVSPGSVAKGDVLYLCLMLLRYRYQNVPGDTPDIKYSSEISAVLPPASSLPSRRSDEHDTLSGPSPGC